MIQLNEYMLRLTTGEDIQVSELDMTSLSVPAAVLSAFGPVLALCTGIGWSELEEAKAGYDAALKRAMKSGPHGCLSRLPLPTCAEIRKCSMASVSTCTTRNLGKRGGKFPICWTHAVDELKGSERSLAVELCDAVVHAWRQDRHVIVVIR